jgi:hypothetical protein
MPPVDFELEIPVIEWLQIHALDRADTGIGFQTFWHEYSDLFFSSTWK